MGNRKSIDENRYMSMRTGGVSDLQSDSSKGRFRTRKPVNIVQEQLQKIDRIDRAADRRNMVIK